MYNTLQAYVKVPSFCLSCPWAPVLHVCSVPGLLRQACYSQEALAAAGKAMVLKLNVKLNVKFEKSK